MTNVIVRSATEADRANVRAAVVELHESERRLHDSRLPGEATADAYLEWMWERAGAGGAVLVAEADGDFAGFAAGWIGEDRHLEETPDSNRFGLLSDVCVLPAFRRHGAATRLLAALEAKLALSGVRRIRLSALAANAAARSTYERAGYAPYEVVYEKVIGTTG